MSCESCPYRHRSKVPSEGNPETCKYVLIGEAPAWDEIKQGRPFVGQTGKILMAFLARVGIKREECYITNSVLCQLPSNAKKQPERMAQAIACCRPRLLKELARINTGAIVTIMGKVARDSLYPHEQGGILASRGWRKTPSGRDILVMLHPAYFLYNPNDAPMLLKDLQRLKRGRQPQLGPFEIARAIPLGGKYGKGKYAWVSDEDYGYLIQWSWRVSDKGYATTGKEGSTAHFLVLERMGCDPEGERWGIDHINRNKLDNRRSNLRPVTATQSIQNRSPKKDASSKYKGVFWWQDPRYEHCAWGAKISYKEEKKFLGYFNTEQEAARAYDAAAKERYVEYAYLNFPEPKLEWTAYVLDTQELLNEFISSLHTTPVSKRAKISFDLETMQVDFQRDRILCMSVSPEYGRAMIIPDSLLYQDGREFVTTDWSKQKWEWFLDDMRYHTGSYLKPNPATVVALRELFSIPGYEWCAHNSKFDMRFLYHLGVENVHVEHDTIVMHYTLDERTAGHGLKALGDDYLDVGDYEAELFNYIDKKSGHYSNVPRSVLYKYNFEDTEITLRLADIFETELKVQGLYEKPYRFPMMSAIPMLLAAELRGMAIDWDEFERIDDEEIGPELDKVAAELREISGHPELNPLSSKRVIEILYDELDFPIIEVRTRAAGKRIKTRSSQKAVLDGWRKMWDQGQLRVSKEAWQFAERLVYYRHVRKMRGSYVRKWPKYRGIDNRVHTSFWLRGTVTGRLSSKDPPMQTIPSKVTDKWGPLIANAHVARKGWSLIYADYSQAELMAAACLSGDEFMLESFRKEDADYHSEVAIAAFGPDFTRDERQACKRLTFGWLFGGNAYEIAMNALQFEGAIAARFAEGWDELFKGYLKWRTAQGELMVKQGYVESIFGRRRRFLLLTDKNVGKAKRIAMNAPIQSAISDLTLVSATKLHEIYKGSDYAYVILLIHDSMVMEVEDEHVQEVSQMMNRVLLETAAKYFPQIPFRADIKTSRRLGDLT